MASNKMTKKSLANYIQEQVTNLYKLQILKEQRESLKKEITLLKEGNLDAYSSSLKNTGDYPWAKFVGNKEKGESDEKQNTKDKEGFENEFKTSYDGQKIETTNGTYTFSNIKYNNNHSSYDLLFTKPKGENKYGDVSLWIVYDPTDGYYIDKYKGIEINVESQDKVKEMLSYNK